MPTLGMGMGLTHGHRRSAPIGPPPPQSPTLFFDFNDPSTMARTGSLVDSITDKIGGVVATGSGAGRPEFFASDVVNGGPIARTRFAGAQFLTLPGTVSINTRALSVFAVTRTAVKPQVGSGDRAALLISGDTTVRSSLYIWDNALIQIWNGASAGIVTGITAAHGTSVQWMTSGAADVQAGSGPAVFSQGTPLTNNTTTGGRIGMWSGTSFPLTGDLLGMLIYNRQLNATERGEVLTWARTRYNSPPTTVATMVAFSGDSITEGVQLQNPQILPHSRDFSYPAQIERLAGGSFRYVNCGIGGAALSNNLTTAQLDLINNRLNGWPGVTRKVIMGLWGTNDISGGRTAVQLRGDIDTWISSLRTSQSGVRIGHGTILPRSGFSGAQNTIRDDVNDYIMARGAYVGAGANLDFRIDTAAFSGLTNPLDTNKYADGTHPTSSGYNDLATGIWNGGLSAQII